MNKYSNIKVIMLYAPGDNYRICNYPTSGIDAAPSSRCARPIPTRSRHISLALLCMRHKMQATRLTGDGSRIAYNLNIGYCAATELYNAHSALLAHSPSPSELYWGGVHRFPSTMFVIILHLFCCMCAF